MYLDVYRGGTGYIPLCISLKDRVSINAWDYFLDHRRMFENELARAITVRDIASDMIPCVVLRYDPVVLTSLFGAEAENIGGRPMTPPLFDDIAAFAWRIPRLDAGVMPELERAIRHFREHTPPDIVICTPPETDPFDVALLLFGSRLFLEMTDRPQLVEKALDVITDAFILVEERLKDLLGEPPREKVSYLGYYMPGIRVAADALVNLSPAMIRRFCYPVFEKLAAAFGKVMVHYCPSPGQKYYHVMKPVMDCPHVLGVDTSGGVDYFDSAENPQRLAPGPALAADCAFTPPGNRAPVVDCSTNINRFTEIPWSGIDDWLAGGFMQLSLHCRRGLILRCAVGSVEEGRELYRLWQTRLRFKT